MKPQIPWLRVFVEGVVIVGSILLAFGLQAWWEGRQERAEERRLIDGLEEEFRAYVATIEGNIDRSNVTLRQLRSLFVDQAPEVDQVPADSLDGAFWALLFAPTWDRASGARDALVGSGQLDLLQSEELRARLSEWQGIKEELLDNQLSVRTYVLEILVPFLSEREIPLVRVLPYGFHPDVPSEARTPPRLPHLTQDLVGVYRRTISDPEFQAFLAYRYYWEVSSSRKYRDVLVAATDIIASLTTERER